MSSDNSPARTTTHLQALMHGRSLLSLGMFLFFATMVWIASGYPFLAAMLPLVIGIPGMLLSLLQLAIDMRDYHRAEGKIDPRTAFEIYMDDIKQHTGGQVEMEVGSGKKELTTLVEDPSVEGRTRAQREMLLWASFYGLVVLVLLFGFWIGVPAFLALFLRYYARESWRLTAILTLAAWIAMYVGLVLVLEQVLFEGFATGWLMEAFLRD
ncbi:MAG: hypothetical protein RL477_944 [Pseudomonadota bacterium]|jgi:hypothetical protein